jgi:hypothetical protein
MLPPKKERESPLPYSVITALAAACDATELRALALALACPAAAGVLGDRYHLIHRAARVIQRMLWLWRGRVARFRAREASWLLDFMDGTAAEDIPDELVDVRFEGAGPEDPEATRLALLTAAAHHPEIRMTAFEVYNLHCQLSDDEPAADRWLFEALDGGRHGRDSLPNMVALTLTVSAEMSAGDARYRGHPTMFDALRHRLLTPECLGDAAPWAGESVLDKACPLAEVYVIYDEARLAGDDHPARLAAAGVLAAVRGAWSETKGWPEFLEAAALNGWCGEELKQLVERA